MKKWMIFAPAASVLLGGIVLVTSAMAPPQAPPVSPDTAQNVSCTVDRPTGDLDGAGLAAIAHRAGWRGDDINIAVAVAKAESGWNPKATNANTNGSVDYGLFQINSIHEAILAGGNWADPEDNAAMAFKVWKDAGGKWTPWVTFWRGTYKQHLTNNEVSQDCSPVLVPACSAKVGGDYANGQIPASALCALKHNPQHKLRADAAAGINALTAAFEQRFGRDSFCITDSYRNYAAQVSVFRRKPGLAARPGTSNHGWGLALDLCGPGGGQFVPGSEYDDWMHVHAPKYGWVHPGWAEPNGSKPEPWHWGFPVEGRPA